MLLHVVQDHLKLNRNPDAPEENMPRRDAENTLKRRARKFWMKRREIVEIPSNFLWVPKTFQGDKNTTFFSLSSSAERCHFLVWIGVEVVLSSTKKPFWGEGCVGAHNHRKGSRTFLVLTFLPPSQIRDIPAKFLKHFLTKSLFSRGSREGNYFFDLHPFTWKIPTPTPLDNLQTRRSQSLFFSSGPNTTRRGFHRTTKAIPRRPWKSKSLFASRPSKTS